MRIYVLGTTEVTSSLFITINYSQRRDTINQVLKANEIVYVSILQRGSLVACTLLCTY